MPQIYVENPRKLIQNKKKIEKELKIKFHIKDSIADIQAKPEDEFLASQVFEAINLGFKVNDALLLKNDDYVFEKINIKEETKRKGLRGIRGRIIGTHGKALEALQSLTDSMISLHNNTVGVIAYREEIENTTEAIKKLIRGSKHGKVYGYIKRHEPRP